MARALAYLLLSHHAHEHVLELLRRIHRPQDAFLLHADAKAPGGLHATLAELSRLCPNIAVLPPVLCSWAGWSLVEVTLRGIAALLRAEPAWSHLILLSEQHWPVRPPEEIAAALQPGVSYMATSEVGRMYPAGRADVLHRFRAFHRELPGVGMFPVGPRRLDPAFIAGLRHGSQWVVLARAACERLAALPPEHAVWAPFRSALLPDETALQTVLQSDAGAGLRIEPRETSYVAWPHLTGRNDMIFTEPTFAQARAEGFLFIRKRPAELPAAIDALIPARPAWTLPPAPAESPPEHGPATALMHALHAALAPGWPGLTVSAFLPDQRGAGPACFLRLQDEGLPPGVSVFVLSADFAQLRAALVDHRAPAEELELRTLAGLPTLPLKVRLPDLFLRREILAPAAPEGGFVQETGPGLVPRLAGVVAKLLTAGRTIAAG